MIIVDSSVWIDYFGGRDTPHARRLDRALSGEEDLATVDLVLTEVLQGFKSDRAFTAARNLLVSLPRLAMDVETYVSAARLFRRLRARGVTVRGAIDCIVAQAAIEVGAKLLTADSDFVRIAAHSDLELVDFAQAP